MATTTTPTTGGPDWQTLAEQATGFLGAIAATVTPSPEQQAVAKRFVALLGALGRPPVTFRVEINDKTTPKKLRVIDPPAGAKKYRVGDVGPGGRLDTGTFSPDSIPLSTVDPNSLRKQSDSTGTPGVIELYDKDNVLLARGVVT